MRTVLIIQYVIPSYRVDIFNLLASEVNLTVLYSEGTVPEKCKFKTEKFPVIKLHYKFHTRNLYKYASKFDVVICTLDFSFFYANILDLLPRKYKIIYWGIGVSASYKCRYDENQMQAKYILWHIRHADSMLFYSDYPVQKYTKLGAPKEKLYVAHNTVSVNPVNINPEKSSILFIGALYAQKKLDILLHSYYRAYLKRRDIPILHIIGDGDQKSILQDYVNDNGLENNVLFHGQITDDELLAPYFSDAIICISPDQAGLSILKSMGYGVPYVTHKNAITGGEIFNIHNGEDGVIIDDFSELEDIILNCYDNREMYYSMGVNAYNYYHNHCKPEVMVSGFLNAINFSCGL